MKLGYAGQEVAILDPDKFVIVPFEVAVTDRTASGKLVKDVIAVKHRFTLYYKALGPDDANIFLSYYSSGQVLSFIYDDSGEEKCVQVYLSQLPRELFVHDWQYSETVSITLEEV